jgi:hypothetical protein
MMAKFVFGNRFAAFSMSPPIRNPHTTIGL